MSGKGYLLDTNAIIQFLKGNKGLVTTQLVINARRTYGLKLPDAIIAGTARANDLTILTADDHFKKLTTPWKVRLFVPDSPRM